MRIFLDEVYDRRINVLSFVANRRKEVSLSEIAEATNFSKKTVSLIIKQFEQELTVSKERFEVSYIHNTVQGVYASNIDLVSISNKYLKTSILYKMIKHIFLMERIDAITFCDLEFISPATFSRNRSKLQKILNQCGLSLTRINEIKGSELRIRNFFFLFFFNASNTWDFDQASYSEMKAYFSERIQGWESLNCIRKRQVCLLLFICNVRISQKKVVKKSILTSLSERFQDGMYTKVFSPKEKSSRKTILG
ncbi:transcriptional antiterminator [Enterococcus rotai]|uniref:helix-turn-helix domain-containing protein n=1 Tax=Enterococcus rotai TaxID=118060 RepID=UPI000A58AB0B|nr:helix-turn-helix domain-containing protein [Enterococcus rotai]